MTPERRQDTPPRRRMNYQVPASRQLLVAVMNNGRDFALARDAHWYRIPVKHAPRAINAARLAFYQTGAFKQQGGAVRYFADVRDRHLVTRRELFPDQANHPRAAEEYHRLALGPLQEREPALTFRRRGRRIVFLSTTWNKFQHARDINDLFHDSPLEDALWDVFRREHIEAERQFELPFQEKTYFLDFALFCAAGRVAVECDGDTWHALPERIPQDNARGNDLESQGWHVLRFNGKQLNEDMSGCLRAVRETINRYGGLETLDGERRWFASGEAANQQMNLFGTPPDPPSPRADTGDAERNPSP